LVDKYGYELPTNLQNFRQKDLTEMKIFVKVLGGGLLFLKHPVPTGEFLADKYLWKNTIFY